MKAGKADSRGRHLLRIVFVLTALFAAGLVTSSVVAGAGPLAVLSDSTSTEPTTESAATSTDLTTTDEETTSEETTTESPTTESTTTDTEPSTTESTPPPSGTPTVASDKDDYGPGAHVTLTGTNWRPGETVTVDVNDDVGQTWRRTVTVTASASGEIADEFNLPDWFVATYNVVATGPISGTARTTFTDASLKIFPAPAGSGVSFTLTYQGFTNSACTTGAGSTDTQSISNDTGGENIQTGGSGVLNGKTFVKFTAPASASTPSGWTFKNWSTHSGSDNTITTTTTAAICVRIPTGGNNDSYDATYQATSDTTPPVVTSINRTGTSPTNTTSSLAWAVVFSESVAGVNTGDFALVNSGLGGSSAIQSVSGVGNSWTVTASTGTGSGTLGLNLVDDDSIVDGAGNKLGGTNPVGNGSFTGQVYTIDRTAPTVTAAAMTLPGSAAYVANTWTNKDVRVTFTCADTGGAGLTGASGNQMQDFTANTSGTTATFSGTCADNAGNSAGSSTFGPIKIDKVAPVASVLSVKKADASAYTPGTWTNQSVTVDFACTDPLSGVASLTPDPVTLASSGEDQSASTTCTDNAGNTDAASQGNIDIDKVAPVASVLSVKKADASAYTPGTWTNQSVTVDFACTDPLSGVASLTPDPVTLASSGEDQSASTTCTDNAGNTDAASQGNIDIDKVAPVASVLSVKKADASAYTPGTWTNQSVTVDFACTDPLSGVASLTPDPVTLASSGEDQSASTTCTDNAGNTDAASQGNIDIDKVAPVASVLSVKKADASAYTPGTWTNQSVTVDFACTDPLSGVASLTPDPVTLASSGEDQSASTTCTDNAGNTDAASQGNIDIDKVAPVASVLSVKKADASAYTPGTWTNQSVTVDFACTDPLSGVASLTPDPVTLASSGEDQSASTTCTDNAGNTDAASQGNIDIDKVAPVASVLSVKKADASAYTPGTWTNQSVTVDFACTDPLSGVASLTPDPVTLASSGEDQSASTTCTDNAGNTDAASQGNIDIDKVAPVASVLSVKKADASAYTPGTWTNQSVTVDFACTDPLSGVASLTPDPVTLASSGEDQSASTTCTDNAGNTDAASQGNIDIDKVAPVASVLSVKKADASAYTPGTWTNQSVTVDFACTDPLSGVASLTPDPVTLASSGEDQSASTTCTDNAGNTDAASQGNIDIDKVAPVASVLSVKKADASAYTPGTWTNQSVTVDFACTDPLSGVASLTPDPVTLASSGEDQSASTTCTDNAGNTDAASQGNIDIDKVAPVASVLSVKKADASAYTPGTWTNQSVTVDFACTDPLSGVASLTPDPVTLASSGEDQSASTTCTDNAGNTDAASQGNIDIDKVAPVASVTGVANGASYTLGSVPAAGCSTTDALSGVQTNAIVQPLTGPGTTNPNGVGSFTATCSGAKDNAGNAGSSSVTYMVIYGSFVLFLQPINNTAHDLGSNPDVSTFKAGSTVPVKFQVKLPNGKIVLPTSAAWVTPQQGGPTGQPVDETVYSEPATSGSSYVPDGDHHQYNWKTDKSAAGFYWLIGAKLDDGQTYKVYISLR